MPARDDRELHVGLDVRTWRMSGLGTYVRELLGRLAGDGWPLRFTLIGPADVREELPEGLRVTRYIEFDAPIYSPAAFLRYPRPGAVDVFHYPHYNLPRVAVRRRVATVFDLFHWHYGSWVKRRYQGFFLWRLRSSAARIITASEKTRRELVRIGGVRPERVHEIALGPGRAPLEPAPSAPPHLTALNGEQLRPPWLLMVGIDQPHKNFDFLLSAMAHYYQRRPDAPPLVWAGPDDEARERRLRQLPAAMRARVALLTAPDGRQLERLYAGARGLIFPSLDEGFGLPPLEAMARGVPVLCSSREPMTQILGGAPLYFESTESASLWRMLDRLIDSESVRERLIERGYACAQQYDWTQTAARTFRCYAMAAGREDLVG